MKELNRLIEQKSMKSIKKMTSTEVINIIQEKIKDEIFCKKEALKAIRFIRKHPNDFLKQNIPES